MNRDKGLVVSLETAKALKKAGFRTLTDSYYMDLDGYILQERVDGREVVLLEKSDILAPNAMELKTSLLGIYPEKELAVFESDGVFYSSFDDVEASGQNEQESLANLYLNIING